MIGLNTITREYDLCKVTSASDNIFCCTYFGWCQESHMRACT